MSCCDLTVKVVIGDEEELDEILCVGFFFKGCQITSL